MKVLISSLCFLLESLAWNLSYRIMLPTDGDNLTSSLSNCITFTHPTPPSWLCSKTLSAVMNVKRKRSTRVSFLILEHALSASPRFSLASMNRGLPSGFSKKKFITPSQWKRPRETESSPFPLVYGTSCLLRIGAYPLEGRKVAQDSERKPNSQG